MKGMILHPSEILALKDGRLAQIRRPVKPQPYLAQNGQHWLWDGKRQVAMWAIEQPTPLLFSGYEAGQQVFVKERHTFMCQFETMILTCPPAPGWQVEIEYSDGTQGWAETTKPQPIREEGTYSWRSPVLMQEWASRFTLHIEAVRVQRVQEITEEEALKCGIRIPVTESGGRAVRISGKFPTCDYLANVQTPTDAEIRIAEFASQWEQWYGAGSWGANPFVWVYDVRKVEEGEEVA